MKKTILSALVAYSFVSFAQIQQSNSIQTVVGSGRNADYSTAVYEALVQATSQVQGVSIKDSRASFVDAMKQLKTDVSNSDVGEISKALKQSVSARTNGRVLSYRITGEKFIKDVGANGQGVWFVELEAKVPGQYTVGLPPDNRRRMVVMPFRSLTDNVNVFGQEFQVGTTCETVSDKINEYLTQTRRFTMLDRAFNAETTAELNRLNLDNASVGDFGRFQQLLVTDYMVIGTVKMYPSPAAVYNPYTGTTRVQDGPFLEVSYRVVLAPTSQLKWAGTVIIPYSACRNDSIGAALTSGMSVAAQEVSHEIINNIYPMRVTAKTTFELVLNQGGVNVREGTMYDVFRQGEAIIDVASGELLGAPEEKIATIQITRSDPKMSYATVAEGTSLAQIPVGAVVRRPKGMSGFGGVPAGTVSPVQVSPGGIVTPPWKK